MRGSSVEDGSATPAVVAAMGVLAALGVVVMALVSVQLAHVKAQATADLAAVAAAQVPSALLVTPPNPTVPCERAALVAERGGVRLDKCWVDGGDVRVVVSRGVSALGMAWAVTARARAGPSGH